MVYGLVYMALGRNLKFSTKTLHQAELLVQRKFQTPVLTTFHCSAINRESKDTKKESDVKKPENKTSQSQMSFPDGKAHVNYVLDRAKQGKISSSDIVSLYQRVLAEGQFKNFKQAPQPVLCIGYAGLVPMLGIPLVTLLSGHAFSTLVFAHLAYGATVLSFLGGCNWYEAMSKNEMTFEKLGWAVTPQLMGWSSLLLPVPLGMIITACGFCLSIVNDVLLSSYPPWMKSLRLVLTGGTVLSFALMLVFYILF